MSLLGMVGPLGEVVATDVDMTWLDQIRHPCLQCVEHDLTADDPGPLGHFDLVHVRMVLHHFGTDTAIGVVKSSLGLLRPGGRLLIEDLGAGDEPAQLWRRRTLARSRARVIDEGLMTETEFEQLQELLARPDVHQLHIASWGTMPR